MKYVYTAALAAALMASSAMAADAPIAKAADAKSATTQSTRWAPAQTRQEAIDRMQKRLDALKAMSDADWQKQRDDRRAMYQQHRQRRMQQGAAPAATPK